MTPSPLRLPRPSVGGGYIVAVLVVALAVAAARLFADILDTNPIVSLLLCGIMFVAWLAGIGPAWLAAGLSVLAFDYYFVPPIYSLYVPLKDVPRVILLAVAAGFVVLLSAAYRSAADSLRRARDNLQLAVADLEQTNKALQRAEQEVRLGEQNLQATLDTIPALVASYGTDGERRLLNRTARDYAGLPPAQVKDGAAWTIFHPEDAAPAECQWRNCLATGKPFQMEVRFRRADGAYRWHLLRRVPRRDQGGAIVGWYGVAFDIEEQKRAQQEVLRAERTLQETIDTIPVLVATYLPDGSRDFVNQTWQDYTGMSLESVRGRGWSITVHADDLEEGERRWRACMGTGEPLHMDMRFRRADGEFRWHALTRVPHRDAEGRIVRWYSVSHDIEDQKRAEAALRRSEAYLAEAQRLSLTGTFGWKISPEEIYWSDQTYRIFAYDPALKPTAELVLARVHPDDVALVRQQMDQASREDHNLDFEHRLLMPDGSTKHLRVLTRSAVDASKVREIIGAVMDITETKRAQEALHAAQAELAHITRVTTLGQLTASIAHEVSQPLVGIVTNGDAGLRWLEREVPDVEEARRAVRRIIGDADRATNVIRRIRDLAKKAPPEMSRLDVTEMIEDVIVLVQRQAAGHRASLRLDLAAGRAEALGDRVQLQQVIINLVMNGIEAMASVSDRPRDLVIRLRMHDAGQLLVAVQDAGIGFEPGTADRLFSPFYTTKSNGMGMGLSICRSIVEAHGGRVWAANNDGPGATIQFTLPRYGHQH